VEIAPLSAGSSPPLWRLPRCQRGAFHKCGNRPVASRELSPQWRAIQISQFSGFTAVGTPVFADLELSPLVETAVFFDLGGYPVRKLPSNDFLELSPLWRKLPAAGGEVSPQWGPGGNVEGPISTVEIWATLSCPKNPLAEIVTAQQGHFSAGRFIARLRPPRYY
jgi:hypothetical protein